MKLSVQRLREVYARARQLVIDPRAELPRMLADDDAPRAVFWPYVAVLAALGPLAAFLSQALFGTYQPESVVFGTVVPPGWMRTPLRGLVVMVLAFGLSVGAWYALAALLARLGPAFGGRRELGGALKTATAIATPIWLAGPFALLGSVPMLDVLLWLAGVAGLCYGVLIGIWAAPLHLATREGKAAFHVLAATGLTVVATGLVGWGLRALVLAPVFGR